MLKSFMIGRKTIWYLKWVEFLYYMVQSYIEHKVIYDVLRKSRMLQVKIMWVRPNMGLRISDEVQ